MSRTIRNILGLFASARTARLDAVSSAELVSDVDHADAELQKRHAEVAGRIHSLAEILDQLSAKGALSEWLEPPLGAMFAHHRAVARENITLQHSVADLHRQAEDNAVWVAELQRQLTAATELTQKQEKHINALEERLGGTPPVLEQERPIADLSETLERSEETARQWYAYAEVLEADLSEAHHYIQQAEAELAALRTELDAERESNKQKREKIQALAASLQQLLDQSQTSAMQYQQDLHAERYKSAQLVSQMVSLEEEDRILRQKLNDADEVNRCIDLARLALVRKVNVLTGFAPQAKVVSRVSMLK